MGARMIAPRIAFASSDITFSSVKKNPEPVTLRGLVSIRESAVPSGNVPAPMRSLGRTV